MRAKTAITANTARKKEGCVAFANDDFENARPVKNYLEIIADNLSKAGCSWGWVSAVDRNGLTHIATTESGSLCGRMKN
jgi:hypothetical protein